MWHFLPAFVSSIPQISFISVLNFHLFLCIVSQIVTFCLIIEKIFYLLWEKKKRENLKFSLTINCDDWGQNPHRDIQLNTLMVLGSRNVTWMYLSVLASNSAQWEQTSRSKQLVLRSLYLRYAIDVFYHGLDLVWCFGPNVNTLHAVWGCSKD